MALLHDSFIGRKKELDLFFQELAGSTTIQDYTRVIFLQGGPGYGKKRFYSEIWKKGKLSLGPTLWIRPLNFTQNHEESGWTQILSEALDTNHEHVRTLLGNFLNAFSSQKDPTSDENIQGKLWAECFLDSVLIPASQEITALKVFFVFDNYNHLNTAQKTWVSNALVRPLSILTSQWEVRFLLSGEEFLSQSSDLQTYWSNTQNNLSEISLPPFSEAETQLFLQQANLTPERTQTLYNETQGVPGQLMEATGSVSHDDTPKSPAATLLKDKTPQQKSWMLWGAHLETISEERLQIFMEADEAAKAFNWLKTANLDLVKKPDGLHMPTYTVSALLAWEKHHHPQDFKMHTQCIDSFQQINDQISSSKNRETLTLLSLFRCFNENLLRTVFPKEHTTIWAFVQKSPHFFIETHHNWKIASKYQPFLRTYRRLFPPKNETQISARARTCWKQQYNTLSKALKLIEKSIRAKEKKREELHKKLKPLLEQILQLENAPHISFSYSNPNTVSIPLWSRLFSLTLEIMGVVVLYLGIMVRTDRYVSYSLFGVAMIALGLFWPHPTEASRPVPVKVTPSSSEKECEETLALLKMDVFRIKSEYNIVSSDLLKEKRERDSLRSRINEPYV
tara:strand:+ start:3711 stop:5576 length:1866 start_codon:yes stop_codon:yes gene_type:complete